MPRRKPHRIAAPPTTRRAAAPPTNVSPEETPGSTPRPRPPAPEDNIGPWQGMRPPYANPSALPVGEPLPEEPRNARAPRSPRPAPYRDVLAGLPNSLIFLAGVWLLVCPWLIEHPTTSLGIGAGVHDVVLGVLLAVLGGARAVSPFTARWAGWVLLVSGAWLVAAPYALSYRGGDGAEATANDVITGAVVLALGAVGLSLGARWGPRRWRPDRRATRVP